MESKSPFIIQTNFFSATRGNEAGPQLGDNMANMKEKDFLPSLVANNILTNQHQENFGALGKKQDKNSSLSQLNKTIIGKLLFRKFKSPDEKSAVNSDPKAPAKSEDVDLVEKLIEEEDKEEQINEIDPIGKLLLDVANIKKEKKDGVKRERHSNKALQKSTIVKSEIVAKDGSNIAQGDDIKTSVVTKRYTNTSSGFTKQSNTSTGFDRIDTQAAFDDFGIPKSPRKYTPVARYQNKKTKKFIPYGSQNTVERKARYMNSGRGGRQESIPIFRSNLFDDDFGGEYASSYYESRASSFADVNSIQRNSVHQQQRHTPTIQQVRGQDIELRNRNRRRSAVYIEEPNPMYYTNFGHQSNNYFEPELISQIQRKYIDREEQAIRQQMMRNRHQKQSIQKSKSIQRQPQDYTSYQSVLPSQVQEDRIDSGSYYSGGRGEQIPSQDYDSGNSQGWRERMY